jgi:hypothetical protein
VLNVGNCTTATECALPGTIAAVESYLCRSLIMVNPANLHGKAQETVSQDHIKALDIGLGAKAVLPHNLSCLLREKFAPREV